MIKKMLAIVVMLFATMSFAAEGDKLGSSVVTSNASGSSVHATFLQDGKSFKPGFTWQYGIGTTRFQVGLATLYDTSAQKVAVGPLFGYQAVTSKYLTLTPVLGIMQQIGSTGAKTQFSYGIEASVDLTGLLIPIQPVPAGGALRASRTYKSLAVVKEKPLGLGGFGVMGSYNRERNGGLGVNYVWEVAPSIGLGVSASGSHDKRQGGAFSPGLGAEYRVWGNSTHSVALWGGADYNTARKTVKPVVAFVYRNAKFDF